MKICALLLSLVFLALRAGCVLGLTPKSVRDYVIPMLLSRDNSQAAEKYRVRRYVYTGKQLPDESGNIDDKKNINRIYVREDAPEEERVAAIKKELTRVLPPRLRPGETGLFYGRERHANNLVYEPKGCFGHFCMFAIFDKFGRDYREPESLGYDSQGKQLYRVDKGKRFYYKERPKFRDDDGQRVGSDGRPLGADFDDYFTYEGMECKVHATVEFPGLEKREKEFTLRAANCTMEFVPLELHRVLSKHLYASTYAPGKRPNNCERLWELDGNTCRVDKGDKQKINCEFVIPNGKGRNRKNLAQRVVKGIAAGAAADRLILTQFPRKVSTCVVEATVEFEGFEGFEGGRRTKKFDVNAAECSLRDVSSSFHSLMTRLLAHSRHGPKKMPDVWALENMEWELKKEENEKWFSCRIVFSNGVARSAMNDHTLANLFRTKTPENPEDDDGLPSHLSPVAQEVSTCVVEATVEFPGLQTRKKDFRIDAAHCVENFVADELRRLMSSWLDSSPYGPGKTPKNCDKLWSNMKCETSNGDKDFTCKFTFPVEVAAEAVKDNTLATVFPRKSAIPLDGRQALHSQPCLVQALIRNSVDTAVKGHKSKALLQKNLELCVDARTACKGFFDLAKSLKTSVLANASWDLIQFETGVTIDKPPKKMNNGRLTYKCTFDINHKKGAGQIQGGVYQYDPIRRVFPKHIVERTQFIPDDKASQTEALATSSETKMSPKTKQSRRQREGGQKLTKRGSAHPTRATRQARRDKASQMEALGLLMNSPKDLDEVQLAELSTTLSNSPEDLATRHNRQKSDNEAEALATRHNRQKSDRASPNRQKSDTKFQGLQRELAEAEALASYSNLREVLDKAGQAELSTLLMNSPEDLATSGTRQARRGKRQSTKRGNDAVALRKSQSKQSGRTRKSTQSGNEAEALEKPTNRQAANHKAAQAELLKVLSDIQEDPGEAEALGGESSEVLGVVPDPEQTGPDATSPKGQERRSEAEALGKRKNKQSGTTRKNKQSGNNAAQAELLNNAAQAELLNNAAQAELLTLLRKFEEEHDEAEALASFSNLREDLGKRQSTKRGTSFSNLREDLGKRQSTKRGNNAAKAKLLTLLGSPEVRALHRSPEVLALLRKFQEALGTRKSTQGRTTISKTKQRRALASDMQDDLDEVQRERLSSGESSEELDVVSDPKRTGADGTVYDHIREAFGRKTEQSGTTRLNRQQSRKLASSQSHGKTPEDQQIAIGASDATRPDSQRSRSGESSEVLGGGPDPERTRPDGTSSIRQKSDTEDETPTEVKALALLRKFQGDHDEVQLAELSTTRPKTKQSGTSPVTVARQIANAAKNVVHRRHFSRALGKFKQAPEGAGPNQRGVAIVTRRDGLELNSVTVDASGAKLFTEELDNLLIKQNQKYTRTDLLSVTVNPRLDVEQLGFAEGHACQQLYLRAVSDSDGPLHFLVLKKTTRGSTNAADTSEDESELEGERDMWEIEVQSDAGLTCKLSPPTGADKLHALMDDGSFQSVKIVRTFFELRAWPVDDVLLLTNQLQAIESEPTSIQDEDESERSDQSTDSSLKSDATVTKLAPISSSGIKGQYLGSGINWRRPIEGRGWRPYAQNSVTKNFVEVLYPQNLHATNGVGSKFRGPYFSSDTRTPQDVKENRLTRETPGKHQLLKDI